MTDLGSIKVTSPAAGQVVDSGQGTVAAVAGALNTGMEIAGKHVERDLLKDLQATEMLAEQQQIDGSNTQLLPPQGEPAEGEAGHEGDMARIATLADAVKQASTSSHKQRAILEMQGVINRAKARYPWAADRLERAGGSYVNTSTRLAQLGLADSVNEATRQAAQDRIDVIYKHAHTLGVDPTLDIKSEQFAKDYYLRKKQQASKEKQELRAFQLKAGHEIQAGRRSHEMDLFVNEQHGVLDMVEKGVLDLYSNIFKGYEHILNMDPGARTEQQKNRIMEIMTVWDKEKMTKVSDVRAAQQMVRGLLNDFPTMERGTSVYEQAEKTVNAFIEDGDAIVQMLEENNFDYVEAMKLRGTMRLTRDWEGMPISDVLLYMGDERYLQLRGLFKENDLMWRSLLEDIGADDPTNMPDLTPANHWALGDMRRRSNDPNDPPEEQVRKNYGPRTDNLGKEEFDIPLLQQPIVGLREAWEAGNRVGGALLESAFVVGRERLENDESLASAYMELFVDNTTSVFQQFGSEMHREEFETMFEQLSSEEALMLAETAGPDSRARANTVYDMAMSGKTGWGVGDTEGDVLDRLNTKMNLATQVDTTTGTLNNYLIVEAEGFHEDGKLEVRFNEAKYKKDIGFAPDSDGNSNYQELRRMHHYREKATEIEKDLNNYIRYKAIRQTLLGNKVDWDKIANRDNMPGLHMMVVRDWGDPNAR